MIADWIYPTLMRSVLAPDQVEEMAQRLGWDLERLELGGFQPTKEGPRTFWTELVRHTGDPLIGLHLSERIDPDRFGPVFRVMRTAPTFGRAVEMALQFSSLIDNRRRAEFRVEGDDACFAWRQLQPLRPEDVAFTAGMTMRFGRALLPDFSLRSLELPIVAEPGDEAEFERVLGITPRFGASEMRSRFAREFLERSLPRADVDEHRHLRRELKEQRTRVPGDPVIEEIESVYTDAARARELEIEQIAARMSISASELRRRLRGIHSSHREQADNARRRVAEFLVRSTDLGLEQVAERVGFAGRKSLEKAFQRWMGATPAAYRRSA